MHKIDKFLAKINSNERQKILFVINPMLCFKLAKTIPRYIIKLG